MTVSVEVPELGESVTEAIIASWEKNEGDYVERDELIAELDTDKISVDVPAPESGVLTSIKYQVDDEVAVGEVLAEIDTDAEAPADAETTDEAASEKSTGSDQTEEVEAGETGSAETTGADLSPAVRRLVDQHDLDPADIEGTGPGGRIKKGDVLDHLEQEGGEVDAESSAPESAPSSAEPPETLVDRQTRDTAPDQLEERVQMSSLRQTIADRLLDVKNETAMLTTFNEVDMSRVIDLRERHRERFQDEYDTKLGFMSFFVKAVIDALKRYPDVNAEIDGDEIVYKNYYHIGVAVGGPEGLVVPVIRDADQLSFADTELAIQQKVDKVYDGSLSLDDLQGGTFTISNGGIYGSMLSTPILNPPQSAILGMHNIVDRPVAVDGEVEIRPIMYLALSYDHRVIDGKEAVSFLKRIKTCIEEPERMLLEV
ncbi:MAG: 2-oxoglutarate dehydrogenase complex dihydrolipoyllysine-residue succinyltransferase [Bradymonadaceae bacterium]